MDCRRLGSRRIRRFAELQVLLFWEGLYGGNVSKWSGIGCGHSDRQCDKSGDEPGAGDVVCDHSAGCFCQCSCICGKHHFLLKETSVFSAISLMDLMFTAKDLIGLYYKTTESLFLLVVFYLLILLPVSVAGSLLERRVRYAGFGN